MRATRWVGPALLVASVLSIAGAIRTGGARLFLVLFIPVVAGSGLLLLLGVVLLLSGLFLLPFSFVRDAEEHAPGEPHPPLRPGEASPERTSAAAGGGLLLIGPVPVFFGSWRGRPPYGYGWAIVLGVVLVLVAVVLFVFAAHF